MTFKKEEKRPFGGNISPKDAKNPAKKFFLPVDYRIKRAIIGWDFLRRSIWIRMVPNRRHPGKVLRHGTES
jgi:hypothetical protein